MFNTSISILKEEVIHSLAEKKTNEATETMAAYLQSKHFFKPIENDKDEEIWLYDDGLYHPNGKTLIKTFVRTTVGHLFTTYLVNQVIAKISAENPIKQVDFFNQQNSRPELIPVENGILNIETKKLHDFTPHKFFFSKINAFYNENATCPNIIKFIKSIVANDDDVKTIQEILGFSLLRDYKFEKGFMFHGEYGRNGKSKLISIFRHFLGASNCASISLEDIEKDQFSIINLHNKLVNISPDLSEHAIKNTGMYKSLTGRDTVNANRKGQSHVQFENYAKMIFACNELPLVNNFSTAFSLRWVMIDFPFKFLPQHELDSMTDKENCFLQDTEILKNLLLEEEMSGLLNWAIEGLKRVSKRNRFSNETNSNTVRKNWLRKSNSVSAFIEDMIEVDYDKHMTKQDFRRYYHDYCKHNKIRQMGDKAIKVTLSKELGVIDSNMSFGGTRTYVWDGIKLKNSPLSLNTNTILKELKKHSSMKYNELLKIIENNNVLAKSLNELAQEGSIIELPKGIWRLKC